MVRNDVSVPLQSRPRARVQAEDRQQKEICIKTYSEKILGVQDLLIVKLSRLEEISPRASAREVVQIMEVELILHVVFSKECRGLYLKDSLAPAYFLSESHNAYERRDDVEKLYFRAESDCGIHAQACAQSPEERTQVFYRAVLLEMRLYRFVGRKQYYQAEKQREGYGFVKSHKKRPVVLSMLELFDGASFPMIARCAPGGIVTQSAMPRADLSLSVFASGARA